jgi:hypothetical protein
LLEGLRDETAEDEHAICVWNDLHNDPDDHEADGYSKSPETTEPVGKGSSDEELGHTCCCPRYGRYHTLLGRIDLVVFGEL